MFIYFFKVAKRGEILKVKVLGTVALIDEGKYFITYLNLKLNLNFCIHIQQYIDNISVYYDLSMS